MGLLEYCKKKKRIIIYGAGLFGRIVRCFLGENGIDIVCFVVTGNPKDKKVLEKEVFDIHMISKKYNECIGILICGNSEISGEMEKSILEMGIYDYFIVDEAMINEIDSHTEFLKHYHDSKKHVLLYHRIVNAKNDIWNMNTSPDTFREHLKYLKSEYEIVRFEDMDFESDSEELAITIDDGYIDSFTNILPICSDLMIPVTIFVSTKNIGTGKEFWWDIIERTLCDNPLCPNLIEWEGEQIPLSTAEEKINACWKMWNKIVLVDEILRDKMLDKLIRLTHDSGKNREGNRTINEDELIELDRSPWITIGAHTVTHTRLTSESEQQEEIEVSLSKKSLERIVGHEVNMMSFPFGCDGDYDMVTINATKKAGYTRVAAVRKKYDDLEVINWNVPRISIHESEDSTDNIRELRRYISLYE